MIGTSRTKLKLLYSYISTITVRPVIQGCVHWSVACSSREYAITFPELLYSRNESVSLGVVSVADSVPV